MNAELDYFREFVKKYVPPGELITDSHLAAAQRFWDNEYEDIDLPEKFDPDILTTEDFVEKSFFPQ